MFVCACVRASVPVCARVRVCVLINLRQKGSTACERSRRSSLWLSRWMRRFYSDGLPRFRGNHGSTEAERFSMQILSKSVPVGSTTLNLPCAPSIPFTYLRRRSLKLSAALTSIRNLSSPVNKQNAAYPFPKCKDKTVSGIPPRLRTQTVLGMPRLALVSAQLSWR